MRFRVAVTAAIAVLLCSSSAQAITKCSVKVDKKTGVLNVKAAGVGGPLLWGNTAASVVSTFFNAGTCVSATNGKNCQIADPNTLAAKTPPAGCTLYLDDGVAPCSAWIAGCSPAPRAASSVVWKDASGDLIGVQNENGTEVVRDDGTAILRIPILPDRSGFAQPVGGAFSYHTSGDCTGANYTADAPTTLPIAQYFAGGATQAFYTQGATSLQSLNSYRSTFPPLTDQSQCDLYFGGGNSTYLGGVSCCITNFSGSYMMYTMVPTDLSAFTGPFQLEMQ